MVLPTFHLVSREQIVWYLVLTNIVTFNNVFKGPGCVKPALWESSPNVSFVQTEVER